MLKNVLKATAALAVLAGSSGALGQVYCSSPNITAGGANPRTVMDTINVSGGPGSIVNMAVTVNINCTWAGDATLILVHNGVGLNLTNWNGWAGDNYTNTRFIDGATPITLGLPPFTGDFAPQGGVPVYFGTITLPGTFLADFAGWAGSDGNGAWDIIVDDGFPDADDVTLVNWCIDFNPGAPPPPPPPPPGDSCNDPPLVAVDGDNPFDTTGATTDSDWDCTFGGSDIHFIYTATADATYQFSTCGSPFGYNTVMMLGSSCGANDYGCLDDGPCGPHETMTLAMTTGQQVHITIGGYYYAVGAGVLTISICAPNPYSPPAGTPENEVCGTRPDVDNGGCNSIPNVFHTIACGETILGTGFYNGLVSDTDVFRFTLDADDTVTFTGQAQFDLVLAVMDNVCPWPLSAYAVTTTNPCNIDFTTSVFLPAGTYNLWMSPLFYRVVNCGTNDSYWVTMSYGAGCPAACDPDVNCDGSANGLDVKIMELAVGGDLTDFCQVGIPGVDDGDFNRDGAVNGTDVEAVENAVGGVCP